MAHSNHRWKSWPELVAGRQYYGPTNRAFASLDESAVRKLREELEALWSANNRGGDEFTVVSSEYLEVIGIRA